MSIALIQQWPTKALIVTDTISSSLPSGDKLERVGFSMKTWTLPHMNMAFAFRGASILPHVWHHQITELNQCRDIEDVHEVAAAKLKDIVRETARNYSQSIRGEFFHYGFPSGSDRIVHYAYTPGNDYEGERFIVDPSGSDDYENVRFFMAPAATTFKTPSLVEVKDYVDLVTRVRAENDQQLVDEPLAIGGDLFATFVENWKIRTQLWHRFPDYEETWDRIQRLGSIE